MPLKPHPTDPDKLVFTAGDYAAPTYFTAEHAMSMTLRDYFAGLAMQGMMARDVFDGGQARPEQRAKLAYIEADAMLKERNK